MNKTSNNFISDIFQNFDCPASQAKNNYKRWSTEEKESLVQLAEQHRNQLYPVRADWVAIAKNFPNRTSRQCMRQYAKIMQETNPQQQDKSNYTTHTRQNSTQIEQEQDLEENEIDNDEFNYYSVDLL